MVRIRRFLCTLVTLLLIAAAPLPGQSDSARLAPDLAPIPASHMLAGVLARSDFPPPVESAAPVVPIILPHMIRVAGTIFAGRVTAIERSPASAKDAVATVAITFHVNQGIRGAITGQDFTLRQWIGLWNSGQQRYRVGEQVLLFLYPASKLGLTSWVAGSLGRLPIDNLGHVLLSPEHVAAFRADPFLGGKSSVSIRDVSRAVRRGAGEGNASRP
jgi:hypothetical protein